MDYGKKTIQPEEACPKWLKNIVEGANKKLTKALKKKMKFNAFLVTQYENGEDKIFPHHDKMKNWVDGAGFAIISFGAVRKVIF